MFLKLQNQNKCKTMEKSKQKARAPDKFILKWEQWLVKLQ